MLRIFISHKMPSDTALAESIGRRLTLYAGNQATIAHAGRFRYGQNWRNEIQVELEKADWLIFLMTEQDEDWGFCLFECGYFRSLMNANPRRRLMTFCRRPEQVNAALEEFNAVTMDQGAVLKLLEEMYLEEPLRMSPGISRAVLADQADQIAKEFQGALRLEKNFDVAPSILIETDVCDDVQRQLATGKIPATALIGGTQNWEPLFGRNVGTGGWTWGDLSKDWPSAGIYEFLIAKMMSDSLRARSPQGTVLRAGAQVANGMATLYRLTLRRFEKLVLGGLGSAGKYRFYFTASPIYLPFEVAVAGKSCEETILYHLVNVSWYFRRRIVDELYERLLEFQSMHESLRESAGVADVLDSLGRELMQVWAQSIVRGLDNPLVVEQALLGSRKGKAGHRNLDPKSRRVLRDIRSYLHIQKRVFEGVCQGVSALPEIIAAVHEMAKLNHEFYKIVAEGYAELSGQLPPPPVPQSGDTRTGPGPAARRPRPSMTLPAPRSRIRRSTRRA